MSRMHHFTIRLFTGLLTFLPFLTRAQTPSVHALRFTPVVQEWYPTTLKGPNGSFYVQSHGRKGLSFNDSTFVTLTKLDASLEPVWARRIKMQRKMSPYNSVVNPDGSLTMLANAYTQSNALYPLLFHISSDGQLLQTREIVDSSNIPGGYDVESFIRLGNGVEILSSVNALLRINPQGQVSFEKKLYIQNDTNQFLNFSSLQSIPGSNGWIGVGNIGSGTQAFYSRWNDTTLINLHVYDAKMIGLNTPSLARPHVHANGEVSHVWNAGSRQLHLHRLQPDGSVIWWKIYNSKTTYPGYLRVSDDGHHWVFGSITPGQAGGIVTHFSPAGDLIKVKGQFKLGSSHGTLTTFEPLPGGDFLALQKGYTNTDIMFLNRVQPSLEFKCFDTNLPAITDTSIALIDSVITNIKYQKRRYGIKTTTSSPLSFLTVAVVKEPVTCTVTDIEEPKVAEEVSAYPNPVADLLHISNPMSGKITWTLTDLAGRTCLEGSAEGLSTTISTVKIPKGIYMLSLQGLESRKVMRVVKE